MATWESTLIGFLILVGIGISVITTVFVWAWPNIQTVQNQDEVFRLENRMIEVHNAIKKVANEQGFLTVPFTLKKGRLFVSANNSFTYKGDFRLPQVYQNRVLFGNRTNRFLGGTDEIGILGSDEPGYLLERGMVELSLKYIFLNDTRNGKCYRIQLTPGAQAAAGPGDHVVFVKWVDENTTNIGGCNTTTQQLVSMHIE